MKDGKYLFGTQCKVCCAPYETDAKIAHVLLNGHADFGITEDSDLLVYGCKKVMVKLKLSGDGEYFQLKEILDDFNLNHEQFRQMCIAAGCNYLTNVKGVGIHTEFCFVKHSTEDL
ncbi:Exonuclease 1 [Paramuricea clavata]|uniref:Exonuclease 1 n=1 Tax=Paramuricea clavata TaxID=317549 RepID=A0A7D9IAX4_PARCT|nr:Exonuclease 1 [Paramuricea clavata]